MLDVGTLRTSLALAPALALLWAAPAAAQEPFSEADAVGGAEAPHVDEEVVVRGRRLSEIEFDLQLYVHDFLDKVAAPARGRGFARWHREVCIGVENIDANAGQYIIDRISRLMLEVGLEPGAPGCRPDVHIIFSTDAQQTAAHLVEREPRLFRPAGGHAGTDLGLDALDEFVRSERPVRWWHVSMPVDARTGAPAIVLPDGGLCGGLRCTPNVQVAGPSRIHSGTRDDLQNVIIIADVPKLTGMTWQALADYLAVVSVAQIDPRTELRNFDSILNLFDNPAAYSGLTDWDRSYVRALYEADQERIPSMQRSDIVSRIVREEMEAARAAQ